MYGHRRSEALVARTWLWMTYLKALRLASQSVNYRLGRTRTFIPPSPRLRAWIKSNSECLIRLCRVFTPEEAETLYQMACDLQEAKRMLNNHSEVFKQRLATIDKVGLKS
jgi:hypothetical protein